ECDPPVPATHPVAKPVTLCLAADAVVVRVEPLRVGIRDRVDHLEVCERYVRAVEIGWRLRDADGRVGVGAVLGMGLERECVVAGLRVAGGRCDLEGEVHLPWKCLAKVELQHRTLRIPSSN